MDIMKDIEGLLSELNDLKYAQREVQERLCSTVMEYDGTWQEAIKMGLVRFNFPVPAGFRNSIINNHLK